MDEVYLLLLIMTPPSSTLPTHCWKAGFEQQNAVRDTMAGRAAALFSLTLANIAAPFCALVSQPVSQSGVAGVIAADCLRSPLHRRKWEE